jgi:hypothetical protein
MERYETEFGDALKPVLTLQRKHFELNQKIFPFFQRIVMSHLEILEYFEELEAHGSAVG